MTSDKDITAEVEVNRQQAVRVKNCAKRSIRRLEDEENMIDDYINVDREIDIYEDVLEAMEGALDEIEEKSPEEDIRKFL